MPCKSELLGKYLSALQQSPSERSFLVIEDPASGDFLQLTASSDGFQIDFPLITERQQELEPRVREVLESFGLTAVVTRGSDGSRFLDFDTPAQPTEVARAVRATFERAFGRLPPELRCTCEGFTAPAA